MTAKTNTLLLLYVYIYCGCSGPVKDWQVTHFLKIVGCDSKEEFIKYCDQAPYFPR